MAKIKRKVIERLRVNPGDRVKLKDYLTDWRGDKRARALGEKVIRKKSAEILEKNREELAEAQELLYADNRYSLLLIFQAMDAAGKDGTIRHVMSGVNPQGCQVSSFKQPSAEELDHNFLWRYAKRLPERGNIGIFNRSYYEEVLVVRVHPEFIAKQRIPDAKVDDKFWERRFEDINNFEHHLARNGTVILKFFLNVSKKEQKERFLERLNNPEKHWKFSAADLAERAHWKEYMSAFEDAISATSTKWAPWYIIPADSKYLARALVADIIVDTVERMDLRYPDINEEQKKQLAAARKELENE